MLFPNLFLDQKSAVPTWVWQSTEDFLPMVSKLDTRPLQLDLARFMGNGLEQLDQKIIDAKAALAELLAVSTNLIDDNSNLVPRVISTLPTELIDEANAKLARCQQLSRLRRQWGVQTLSRYPHDSLNRVLLYGEHRIWSSISGRMSAAHPNTMAIPKMILPYLGSSSGGELIKVDVQEAEIRLLAGMSADPALINVFESGGDLYVDGAQVLYQTDQVNNVQRNVAKRAIIGIIYGQQQQSLTHTLAKTDFSLDVDAAQRLFEWLRCHYDTTMHFLDFVARDQKLWLAGKRTDLVGLGLSTTQRRVIPVQSAMAKLLKQFILMLDEQGLDVIEAQHDAVFITGNQVFERVRESMEYLLIQSFDCLEFRVPYEHEKLLSIEKV